MFAIGIVKAMILLMARQYNDLPSTKDFGSHPLPFFIIILFTPSLLIVNLKCSKF